MNIGVSVIVRIAISLILLGSTLCAGTTGAFSRAEEMYSRAQYDAAIEVLRPFPTEPEALRITGKSFFMLGDFKKAIHYFQKLVSSNPLNSVDLHWLGKAWARRAETSNAINAQRYATTARRSIERAVELDPKNLAALKDLLDLYLEGRHLDRARAVAGRISQLDDEEGRMAQALITQRGRELSTAEEQVRMAIDEAPRQVGHAIDLARTGR